MTIKEFTEHKAEAAEWLNPAQKGVIIPASQREVIDEEGEVIAVEQYAAEEDIIKAINAEQIYFFPNGCYLFITDKGEPWKIKKEDRKLTEAERNEIEAMRYEVKVSRGCIDTEIYKQLIKDYSKKVKAIYAKAEEEGHFRAIPLKRGKQIRIFISAYYTDKFKNLGYKVIEQEREVMISRWDDTRLSYYQEEASSYSYSFIMNYNAFISACKSGKIPYKGCFISEDGEMMQTKQSGQSEAIRVITAEGEEKQFKSKADAAKAMKISPSLLSNLIKATPEGEAVRIIKGTLKNSKGITLITAEGERLEFKSVRDAAAKLGFDKSKISRCLKGKQSGDKVTLSGVDYTLG